MKSVGFIGLGTMGGAMASNLLKKGYSMTVYNRSPEKMEELLRTGADAAASPAMAAKSVDVLFTCVSDDQALLDIILGQNGVIEGVHPGLTVIDCSTVSPDTSKRVAEELSAHFVDFLDAPITGSKTGAIEGTLAFMVGGNEDVFAEQADLFQALGKKALLLGPTGSGSYAKLAHNTIVGINSAAVAEGMSIATKAGLDPAAFLEIVLSGGANSRQAELKGQKIIDRDFSAHFSLRLMLKDLQLAGKLTQEFQLPSPLLQTATSLYQIGLSKGLGNEDLSSVVQCYEDWMNQKVVRKPKDTPAKNSVIPSINRRKGTRIKLDIKLQLSIYQWEQEGSFSGQNIQGTLYDLSENGLQIASTFPLAKDMFVIIHFPKEADLPPIIGRIIRIEPKTDEFRYGCMLSGVPPYIRLKLEEYIQQHIENA